MSISSLALKTFLNNYYEPNKTPIYRPKRKHYNDIVPAYFGGLSYINMENYLYNDILITLESISNKNSIIKIKILIL